MPRNMFDIMESGYAGRWVQPGLDNVGPTDSELKRATQRETLARAKKGVLGKKRKTYYERQLEKFGFR